MERFFTVEQVAESLQVHLDTVRRWLRTGQLQGLKIGRVWRISESELSKLAGHSQTPPDGTRPGDTP